ncbi:MAG: non-reducing end alpha-L-arabinofuranosidase family hydrolase [Pirellulales bacterium]
MKMAFQSFVILVGMLAGSAPVSAQTGTFLDKGSLQWRCSPPWIAADSQAAEPEVALKDPTVVSFQNRWHVFATHRMKSGKVDMQYLQFEKWEEAGQAKRHPIHFQEAYHCAPQVFYFRPHQKWYLIFQAASNWLHPGQTLPEHFTLAPVFSTTDTIDDPRSWSPMQRMKVEGVGGIERPKWIDFWVICDEAKAHLFYTRDDGTFWRSETSIDNFPQGWNEPVLVLQDTKDELFEASHTYKVRGTNRYLTLIEAIGKGKRYYKAWVADSLEGAWQPWLATSKNPFADAQLNVESSSPWTTSVSHGELIRSGIDERLEIDGDRLRFVFQGVDDAGYGRNAYGGIPWKIGILEQR